MTVTVQFPRSLLREKSHSWNLLGVAQVPGQTAATAAAIVRSDGGGFWSCVMNDVSLSGQQISQGLRGRQRQKQSTLAWRAVRQYCDGGVRTIVVPRNDALFIPFPAGATRGQIPHSDGSLFDDGSGYYQSACDVTTTGGSLRDTTLVLRIAVCGDLQGGEAFSINHTTMGWRMYEIATVDYAAIIPNQPFTYATVTFMPPLRQATPDGTVIEFDRPRCTMRLAKTSSMDLTVAPWTFNTASVDFVEAFS